MNVSYLQYPAWYNCKLALSSIVKHDVIAEKKEELPTKMELYVYGTTALPSWNCTLAHHVLLCTYAFKAVLHSAPAQNWFTKQNEISWKYGKILKSKHQKCYSKMN